MVKETTSVLTLSDERVGSGGNDIDSTTSLSKGRVGSIIDETELMRNQGITFYYLLESPVDDQYYFSTNVKLHPCLDKEKYNA